MQFFISQIISHVEHMELNLIFCSHSNDIVKRLSFHLSLIHVIIVFIVKHLDKNFSVKHKHRLSGVIYLHNRKGILHFEEGSYAL